MSMFGLFLVSTVDAVHACDLQIEKDPTWWLPGKSGIGGDIVAIHPGQYAIVVWSPPLNAKGISVRGMKVLDLLMTMTGLSIF